MNKLLFASLTAATLITSPALADKITDELVTVVARSDTRAHFLAENCAATVNEPLLSKARALRKENSKVWDTASKQLREELTTDIVGAGASEFCAFQRKLIEEGYPEEAARPVLFEDGHTP